MAVWYAKENVGVLIEENIGESGLGNAAGASIGDKTLEEAVVSSRVVLELVGHSCVLVDLLLKVH